MQICRDASRDSLESGFIAVRKRSVDATRYQADVRDHITIAEILGTICGVHDLNGSGAGHGAEPQLGRNLGIAWLETDGDVYVAGYGADQETVMQIVGAGNIVGDFVYALLTGTRRDIWDSRHDVVPYLTQQMR